MLGTLSKLKSKLTKVKRHSHLSPRNLEAPRNLQSTSADVPLTHMSTTTTTTAVPGAVTNGTPVNGNVANPQSNSSANTTTNTSSTPNGTAEDDSWFQRTCADLSERKVADVGDPNAVMNAVVAKSSLLWDNKSVRTLPH